MDCGAISKKNIDIIEHNTTLRNPRLFNSKFLIKKISNRKLPAHRRGTSSPCAPRISIIYSNTIRIPFNSGASPRSAEDAFRPISGLISPARPEA